MAKSKRRTRPRPIKKVSRKITSPKLLKRAKNARAKKSSRKKKTKKQISRATKTKKPRRHPKKITKTKTRVRGFASRIDVVSRKHGLWYVTIDRRTAQFYPELKIPRWNSTKYLYRRLMPASLRYFKSIGKSLKSLYYIRFLYTYESDSGLDFSHFSIGISSCRSEMEFKRYLLETISAFIKAIEDKYSRRFTHIRISDLIVQGYKK